MAKAKRATTLTRSAPVQERIRREFSPRDYPAAFRALARRDTKAITPGESPQVMHVQALNYAQGMPRELSRGKRIASSDFRDFLCGWGARNTIAPDIPFALQGRDLASLTPQEELVLLNAEEVTFGPEFPSASTPSIPEEEAFLAAIAKSPADNLTRLVYADWLDERDDPRGAYVRVLCEWLASRKTVDEELFAREEELRVGLSQARLARIRGMPMRDKKK